MNGNFARRKEPDAVRRALLDGAASLAAREGFAAVTIQSVAEAAGVTKGGLFHHFANKQALVAGMFTDQLEKLDATIDAHIASDSEAYGAFTRAYVAAIFDQQAFGRQSVWAAMAASFTADPMLRGLWANWYRTRVQRHHATDGAAALEVVRLAADGAWYAYLIDDNAPDESALRRTLDAMTRPNP